MANRPFLIVSYPESDICNSLLPGEIEMNANLTEDSPFSPYMHVTYLCDVLKPFSKSFECESGGDDRRAKVQ